MEKSSAIYAGRAFLYGGGTKRANEKEVARRPLLLKYLLHLSQSVRDGFQQTLGGEGGAGHGVDAFHGGLADQLLGQLESGIRDAGGLAVLQHVDGSDLVAVHGDLHLDVAAEALAHADVLIGSGFGSFFRSGSGEAEVISVFSLNLILAIKHDLVVEAANKYPL